MAITLTINGIDGFTSGKWSLHANAKVIDDETLELNAVSGYEYSNIDISVRGNEIYIASIETNGRMWGWWRDDTSAIGASFVINSNQVMKAPSNAKYLRFHVDNNSSTGKFTFKKPMLHLGSQIVPYEPKRGERMVEPVVKKNLLSNTALRIGYRISSGFWTDTDKVYRRWEGVLQAGTYTVKINNPSGLRLRINTEDGTTLGGQYVNEQETFTLDYSKPIYINLRYSDSRIIEDDIFPYDIKFQLEQGTIATPYEPYGVQINKHAKNLVPKKNLIPSFKDSRWSKHANLTVVDDYEAVHNATATYQLSKIVLPCEIGKSYTLTQEGIGEIEVYQNGSFKVSILANSTDKKKTFTSTHSSVELRFHNGNNSIGQFTFKEPMLVEGSTQQSFEPYKLVNPPSRKGQVMNGQTYVQLPSLTMDSIEIDCLIDSVQSSGVCLVDGRTGLSSGYFSFDNTLTYKGNGWNTVEGFKKGERTNVKLTSASTFTNDINIFSNYLGGEKVKGILYGIKCYLNGYIVWESDFTRAHEGNTLHNGGDPVNLLPSFDRGKWILHANAKVYGKDVLELVANAGLQANKFTVSVSPNTTYKIQSIVSTNGRMRVGKNDGTNVVNGVVWGTYMNGFYGSGDVTFTTDSVTTSLIVILTSDIGGTFTFQQPKLIKVGQTGSIVGNPQPQLKKPKRVLFARR